MRGRGAAGAEEVRRKEVGDEEQVAAKAARREEMCIIRVDEVVEGWIV